MTTSAHLSNNFTWNGPDWSYMCTCMSPSSTASTISQVCFRILYESPFFRSLLSVNLCILELTLNWHNFISLNCPCPLYGSIYHQMHSWAPHCLVYSKVYVDRESLFLFWIWLHDLFVKNEEAPCYARPIHGKGALALGQFSTRAILSHTLTGNRQKVVERIWRKYRQYKVSARSESY